MNARKLIGAAALSLLGSMLFTAQAQAENGHAYNGAFCKAYYGSQTSNFRHQTTGIYNAGAGARYVNCPVVVDEIANLTGTTRVWAHWRAANVGSPSAAFASSIIIASGSTCRSGIRV